MPKQRGFIKKHEICTKKSSAQGQGKKKSTECIYTILIAFFSTSVSPFFDTL